MRILLIAVVLADVFTVGCAHSRDPGRESIGSGGYLAPEPPAFLSGPLAVVLTNIGGFGAHVVMQTTSTLGHPEVVSGQLLGRGSKLLFEPDDSKFLDKRYRSAGISFVWDVAENRGCVLS